LIPWQHAASVHFRYIMSDERLGRIPKVIEMPKRTDPTAMDAKMLARLRGYIATG